MNRLLLKEQLEKVLKENFIFEFVVPMGYSLVAWKEYKEKNKISNADYYKKHPDKKWKVVHGHKAGKIGKSLPGLNNISYNKANKAHSAIVMSGGK